MLKNSQIKLIAFDLDGTLLDDQKKISEYTQNILNKIDCQKIIVTTRTSASTKDVINKIKVDGIICSNGS